MQARQILDYALPLLSSDYRRLQRPSTVLQPYNGNQSFNEQPLAEVKGKLCFNNVTY